jgi:FCP1-like phosphatase family protein
MARTGPSTRSDASVRQEVPLPKRRLQAEKPNPHAQAKPVVVVDDVDTKAAIPAPEALSAPAGASSTVPAAVHQPAKAISSLGAGGGKSSPSTALATIGGKAEKLALVLDIDQTLVHAMRKSAFDRPLNLASYVNEDGDRELYEWQGPRGADSSSRCYVKLRPGVRSFLQNLRPFYEMSIFSFGTKEYVDFVISLIDPDRTIFARKRVFCRDHLQNKKKHLTPVLQAHKFNRIVIFDDRHDTWQSVGSQMLKAFPYTFLERLTREEVQKDHDAHLKSVTRLLRLAHKEVASKRHDSIMSSIQGLWSKTLAAPQDYGARLLLEGAPQDYGLRVVIIESGSDCLRSAARAFGAIVLTEVDADLHAVVVQDLEVGEAEIDKAEELGVPIVHGLWLSFCFATFQLQDPAPFNWQAQIPPDMWEAYAEWDMAMNIGEGSRCPSVPKPEVWQRLEKGRHRRLAAQQALLDDDDH